MMLANDVKEARMQKIEVRLETVTPLFLGGAEGKNSPPELRPPAFRGAMRYWLRAALGGVIEDENLEGLHKLETAVFGDTDSGSPITVRIVQKNLPQKKYPILPHKTPSGKAHAFLPGQQFELILQAVRPIEPLVWVNAAMALNLALTFGGVGLRSRRGYGTLCVIASEEKNLVPISPTTKEKWEKRVSLIARSVMSLGKDLAESRRVKTQTTLPILPTKYPAASSGGIVAISDEVFPTASDAVIALMRKMPNDRYVGYVQGGRQASPLWVRVIKADGQYRLLFCVLPSRFSGANYDKLAQKVGEFATENIEIEGWNK
jgi:CRISPR-associated protein Cmr1